MVCENKRFKNVEEELINKSKIIKTISKENKDLCNKLENNKNNETVNNELYKDKINE